MYLFIFLHINVYHYSGTTIILCSFSQFQNGDDCLKCGLVSLVLLANLYFAAKMRESIREKKGIEGSFCNDCLMSFFCGCCTLTQEAREVEADLPGIPEIQRS